jgi:hypothetical protein
MHDDVGDAGQGGSMTSITAPPSGLDGGAIDASAAQFFVSDCTEDPDAGGPVRDAGAPVRVLASGQDTPLSIVVDEANVYWLDQGPLEGPGGKIGYSIGAGRVMRCPIAGCDNRPAVLASGWTQASALPIAPSALALDGTNLYWPGVATMPTPGQNAWGMLLGCSTSGCGCSPSVLAEGIDDPTGVFATGGSIYWTEYDVNEVVRCSTDGCAARPILANSVGGPTGILADGSYVYWVNTNGGLMRCPLSGCGSNPTVLWTGVGTQAATLGLAADATNLYWTNSNPMGTGSVMQCAKADCAGTVFTLAYHRNSPRGIAVDGTDVYWTEESVYRCTIGGCGGGPVMVAAAGGQALAVDGNHVYASTATEVLVIDK